MDKFNKKQPSFFLRFSVAELKAMRHQGIDLLDRITSVAELEQFEEMYDSLVKDCASLEKQIESLALMVKKAVDTGEKPTDEEYKMAEKYYIRLSRTGGFF